MEVKGEETLDKWVVDGVSLLGRVFLLDGTYGKTNLLLKIEIYQAVDMDHVLSHNPLNHYLGIL
jgi:hypothetical protein